MMANVKRLIDANALLEELDKFANPMPNKSGYDFLCGVATAITEIENAPPWMLWKWCGVRIASIVKKNFASTKNGGKTMVLRLFAKMISVPTEKERRKVCVSQRRAKRERRYRKWAYEYQLKRWLVRKPPWWRFSARRRWKACKPTYDRRTH